MIKKCIIPAAGIGSRMLPITKVIPKEILPIVNEPVIYYGVTEIKNSGIDEIIFITSPGKEPILNYFDYSHLEEKYEDKLKHLSSMIKIISVRQIFPKGLGDAIGYGKGIVNEDYFAVLLPDDLIFAEKPVLLQMIEAFEKRPGIYISLMEVEEKAVSSYGIVKGDFIDERVIKIEDLIEKPTLEEAPSRYAIIGRYILPKEIFDIIENLEAGKKGEIQLTDAIKKMGEKIPIYGYVFEGERFDTGNKAGFVKANIMAALKRDDTREDILKFLRELVEK